MFYCLDILEFSFILSSLGCFYHLAFVSNVVMNMCAYVSFQYPALTSFELHIIFKLYSIQTGEMAQ